MLTKEELLKVADVFEKNAGAEVADIEKALGRSLGMDDAVAVALMRAADGKKEAGKKDEEGVKDEEDGSRKFGPDTARSVFRVRFEYDGDRVSIKVEASDDGAGGDGRLAENRAVLRRVVRRIAHDFARDYGAYWFERAFKDALAAR